MTEETINKDYELRLKLIDDLASLKQKAYSELIGSIYKIIQTIGIVAGFGFTAIGMVESLKMFLFGEAFLFLSIFYGVYKTHLFYEKENAWIDKMVKKIDLAGEKLKDKTKTVDERHENFKGAILDNEKSELIKSPLLVILSVGIVGAILLLLSFIHFCIFYGVPAIL